ncbi:MAG: YqcI/YcgG family protein [Candidatus Obscuribacter sp.]|nr:YqcI/YcgG family protein [Candidatus Obscuribacter sp.]
MNKVKVPDEEERARQFKLSLPDLEREKSIEDIFERYEAQAYSCYAGIEQPGGHNQPHGNKLLRVIPPDKLWPDKSDALIPPLGEAAHDQLRAFILGEYYPCIGARAAFTEGSYRLGFYKHLAHISSVAAMGRDLKRFVGEYAQIGGYTTFVAIFKYPQITTEEQFEKLLWTHLQMMHDHDVEKWDPHYSSNPDDANFAFSFHGEAFFVVGMHPGASRFSRRFGYTALVFNPESQIRHLQEHGMLKRFAGVVRERDTLFQGSPNPSLPVDGGTTGGEARVYSGKSHPTGSEFRCPFHPRTQADK